MRGKPVYGNLTEEIDGITPADAGKTIQLCCMGHATLGSPPRMRGKLGADLWPLWLYGITPADAGKTD